MILGDLVDAFGEVMELDLVTGILPLAIVAVGQGLRAGGFGDVFGKASAGLIYAGLLAVLIGGTTGGAAFDLRAWSDQFVGGWQDLMQERAVELLGYWLFLLAGTALTFALRSLLRR